MLRCLFIKRKLYEYFDNSLSQIERIKVKGHLELCSHCREELYQLKNIIEAASTKKIPQPSAEFWHNFKINLDRKLNEKLAGSVSVSLGYSSQLRQAFAYAMILIFVLSVGSYLHKRPYTFLRLAAQNESLEDDLESIDEEIEVLELNQSEDAYIDELNLLYQFDQA